ncbi:NAD-P-binding protein [Pterulicium gracile]|uniref:NAD-P-binding protein n=1 Tax=Pterulicium gracile TaxID=1884261 RepID=A0A5C3QI84_9AGAR|nr:NAD-P-binding protein [Pterula gracilis]
MSNKVSILFTGATGYIGGAVLERLLNHPDFARFQITAVVRSAEKAEKLNKLGVDVVVGSHSDADIVTDLAAKADVVFSIADCDDLTAAQAILDGLKKRFEKTAKKSILIHTVRTLIDNADGAYTYNTIYDDNDIDLIETLPDSALHRHVDLPIVAADKEGYVKTYIILPSMVWGPATGKLVDLGIRKLHSMLIPALVKLGEARGQAGVAGKGLNTWPQIHVDESGSSAPAHGREGYYFGENGHYLTYDLCKAVAVELAARGIGHDTPTAFTEEEYKKDFIISVVGTNARCKASRAKALGWNPKYGNEDLFASVKGVADVTLKN